MSSWDRSIGDIIAEIKMTETDFNGFYWLVEGPSDTRFFEHRKYSNIEIIPAGGKRNVIGVIRDLHDDPVNSKILGIVDADIDWLIPTPQRPSNIISTDPRDLEGILLRSRSLDKLLSEYAEPKKISAFEARMGKTVREYIHDTSDFFGKIRAANDLHKGISLKKNFRPQIFIKKDKWEYDFDAALKNCVDRGVADSTESLKDLIEKLPQDKYWHYVRGHDAVNILTGGLIKEIGRGGLIDDSRIESALRIGIEDEEYKASKIYEELERWKAEKFPAPTLDNGS